MSLLFKTLAVGGSGNLRIALAFAVSALGVYAIGR